MSQKLRHRAGNKKMRTKSFLSILVILASTSFTNARLTPQERRLVLESSDQSTPDYCSACLHKAMNNHFPQVCTKDVLNTIAMAAQPSQIEPSVVRCVCIAFRDTLWMQKDCWAECEFAKYTEAMQMIPKVMDYSGCDQWVDLKTIAELNKPGFPKPDLGHKSVVHEYVEEEKSSRSFGGALKQKLEETYVSKEEKDLGENCEGNKYRKSHEDENEKEGKAKQGDAVATRSRGVKDDL